MSDVQYHRGDSVWEVAGVTYILPRDGGLVRISKEGEHLLYVSEDKSIVGWVKLNLVNPKEVDNMVSGY